MADINPIKQVYDGLWTVLEAHTGFTDIVVVGNRIKLTKGLLDVNEARAPDKGRVLDADFPQVRIVPAGADSYPRDTSTGTRLDLFFRIEAKTGEKQYDDLALLTWETMRAMIDWRTATDGEESPSTALAAMTWASKTFVTDISMLQRQERVAAEKSIPGWQAVWQGRARMDFDTSDL